MTYATRLALLLTTREAVAIGFATRDSDGRSEWIETTDSPDTQIR